MILPAVVTVHPAFKHWGKGKEGYGWDNQEWDPKDWQLCPARVPQQLWDSLSWAPGQALVVVPPYRLLPHPTSRYFNSRPPKMCRANPTLPAGSLPVLQPSVLAGHQEQCIPLPVAAPALSLRTALLASTCPRSCRCHSSVLKQLQVCTGDTKTLQLLSIHGASAAHLEGNAPLAVATCASSFTGFNPCSPSTS